MKKNIEVGIYLLVALSLEGLFRFIGLPIALGDLLLIGLSILLVYIFLSNLESSTKKSAQNNVAKKAFVHSLQKICYVMLFIALGVSLIYIGLTEPLELIVGVKGSAHGYSLVISGSSIIVAVIMVVYANISGKNA